MQNNNPIINRIIYFTLSSLLGAVFIFSGYIKLYPIEAFELNFIDVGIANWFTAPIIARLLIGLEIGLGLLLLLQFQHRKFTLKAVTGLLVFFTLYLIFAIIKDGNSGNCGCFGTYLEMTPLQSIAKNVVMIGFAMLLWYMNINVKWRYTLAVWIASVSISAALPFILNPPDFYMAQYVTEGKAGYTLPLELLTDKEFNNDSLISKLKKGKHIVAFLSATCPHCKIAGLKLHIMHNQHPTWNIQFIVAGNKNYLSQFWEETKGEDVPHVYFPSDNFVKLSGPEVPVIMAIDNGVVKKKFSHINLKDTDLLPYVTP
jgi:hypothetical protein